MDTEVRERFERIERNVLEISQHLKELSKAQVRTEETLKTLLDALLTGRGNGHGTLPPHQYPGE